MTAALSQRPPMPQPTPSTPRNLLRVIAIVGIALSLFQLYAAGIRPLGLFFQRPIHLGFILVLCFLIYPVFGQGRARGKLGWAIDGPLIACSILASAWVPLNIDAIANAIFPRQIDV
ncbi:MAG: TRAP transporter permease, partial [Albidovulum sp.]